jgi:uncharacterized protein
MKAAAGLFCNVSLQTSLYCYRQLMDGKDKKMTIENQIPPQTPVPAQALPLPASEEKTWRVLAHLTVLLNLITGFAGPIGALIIYLIYKDRSRRVAYDALQSMIMQLLWWYGGGLLIGVMWSIVGILSAVLIGIVLIPFALLFTFLFALLPIGAVIYGIVGAVQVNEGKDFKYWLAGDWVRGTLIGNPGQLS